jgi:hypothetical protein
MLVGLSLANFEVGLPLGQLPFEIEPGRGGLLVFGGLNAQVFFALGQLLFETEPGGGGLLVFGGLNAQVFFALGQLPFEIEPGRGGLLVFGGLNAQVFFALGQLVAAAGERALGRVALGLPGLLLSFELGPFGRQRLLTFAAVDLPSLLEGGFVLVELFATMVELGACRFKLFALLDQAGLLGFDFAPPALDFVAVSLQFGLGLRQGGLALGQLARPGTRFGLQPIGFLAALLLLRFESLALAKQSGALVVELGRSGGRLLVELGPQPLEFPGGGLALGVGLIQLRFSIGQFMRAGFQIAALALDFVAGPLQPRLRLQQGVLAPRQFVGLGLRFGPQPPAFLPRGLALGVERFQLLV